MTYSIVARDAETGELGVAVQSRAFNTGAACAWAAAGVGAIATQSFTERRYGPRGLALLGEGRDPREALDELLATDEGRDVRQVAFVDTNGATAAHTGSGCIPHAGHLSDANVSVQGNMLRSPGVWPAMREAFDAATGTLAERLLAALDAAEASSRRSTASSTSASRITRSRSRSSAASTGWRPATGAGTGSTRRPIRTRSARPRSRPACGRTRRRWRPSSRTHAAAKSTRRSA